jgi:hypothetical protein
MSWREEYDTDMESHLQRLGDSFSALHPKVVVPQLQTGQRLVYLHGKTASTREKTQTHTFEVKERAMTLKIGKPTSSDLAIALPPSGPRSFPIRSKSVSEVFTCMIEKKTKKMISSKQSLWLSQRV